MPGVARTLRDHRADPTLALVNGATERRARFAPKRTDDLRPEWKPFMGKIAVWFCAGDADPARYPGQLSWMVRRSAAGADWPFDWVPDEDLVEVDDA